MEPVAHGMVWESIPFEDQGPPTGATVVEIMWQTSDAASIRPLDRDLRWGDVVVKIGERITIPKSYVVVIPESAASGRWEPLTPKRAMRTDR